KHHIPQPMEKQPLLEEHKQQTNSIKVTQHNIENATRSSIILQPPTSQHTINSPLFAHLGQMVSTPIGPPTSEVPIATVPSNTCNVQLSPSKVSVTTANVPPVQLLTNITTAVSPPSYQSSTTFGQNILTNIPNAQGHTFPVLYGTSMQFISSTSDLQPASLYNEYMQNPYNFNNVQSGDVPVTRTSNIILSDNSLNVQTINDTQNVVVATNVTQEVTNTSSIDLNKNVDNETRDEQQNIFQSSNYFSNEQNVVSQSGMEFLDSIEQCNEYNTIESTEVAEIIDVESIDIETDSTKTNEMNSLDSTDLNVENALSNQEYVNPRGIRFTPQSQEDLVLMPYGLASVRELFRFLISLCNPMDKQNTDVMIHLGLSLLTVALEVGADSIGKYSSLLALVKDDLCRNLFSLLSTERISMFAADLQLSFLMFESLRTHLKFQLECYLTKLIEIIVSDSVKVTYEHKEIALDNILQMWRIPGLVTELYLNYDCNLYCTNLYEDITKLLAKNAFPVTAGIYNTHLLSLDALLTVIESIETNCNKRLTTKCDVNGSTKNDKDSVENINNIIEKRSRQKISDKIPTSDDLLATKNIKRWLPMGTEHFNIKPKKGIQFLQEHGVLNQELNPQEIVQFLRENPALDKKMIGEYISSRNNPQVLEAFVNMFDFTDMRIDEALRLYLETFRLPGEAPLISLLLEHFADRWHKCNGEPFADVDAAFTLAYAIILLNVDQHNHNVKKQSVPMTAEAFKKNLKKVNGGNDFDQDLLDEIYNSIKNEEIVMPAEQTGIVKENYLWKVLLRRGASKDGVYTHVCDGTYDYDLFTIIFGPVLSALTFVFDRSDDSNIYRRALQGFERCACISSNFGITANLDMLILTLCKFT
ncbi:hypothetical protein AMK59_2713, partial [Oryctes borbonicus]